MDVESESLTEAPGFPVAPEVITRQVSSVDTYRELSSLNNSHLAILEAILDGLDDREIAGKLSCTTTTVRMLKNSPLFQQELSRRRSERNKEGDERFAINKQRALERLGESLDMAVTAQVGLLASSDDKVRQTAVDSIFDRCFGKGGDISLGRVDETAKGLVLNVNVLNNIQETLKEVNRLKANSQPACSAQEPSLAR